MSNTTLSRNQFFVLHEKIVEQANELLSPKGGLTKSKESFFYGFGDGVNCKTSINYIVLSTLNSKRYDFDDFSHKVLEDGDSEPKFNGEKLYRLKLNYNKQNKRGAYVHSNIKVPTNYLKAYFSFLEINSVDSLELVSNNMEFNDTINHTQSVKFSTQESALKKTSGLFGFRRMLPLDYGQAIKEKLENSSWYLYTYNFDRNLIVRAVLEIGPLGDEENFVSIINPKSAYKYIGYVNCRLAHHRIIQFDLITEVAYAKQIYSMFYVNFLRPAPKLILGQQLSFGHHHEINSSNSVLVRIDESNKNLIPDYLDPTDEWIHPAIKKFLDPMEIAYRIIPRHTFENLEHFEKWLEKPDIGQPAHFPRK